MIRFSIPYVLILFLAVPTTHAQQAGVDVLHYVFDLTLSDQNNRIRGESTITVSFSEEAPDLFELNLIQASGETGMDVEAVEAGGTAVSFSHEADRIRIRRSPRSGEQIFLIRYAGIPADGLIIDRNLHGDRTFFGDNWPNRARHWLPTVDHPSDKATVEWKITAPDHYQVIASGSLIEEFDSAQGTRLTHWKTDVPLATKVMVFGAARFAVHYDSKIDDIPIQSWVYPQDREDGYFDFGVTGDMMRFFIDQIGPYPYEKIANVQSKTRYGGMENASNIFYNETAITGERRNERTVAHEIAHQWFGDSVTEKDWPHIWLSEGFATYFAQLYFEHAYGRSRLDEGMQEARERVLSYARSRPPAPLVNTKPRDPNEHLNTNSYQKGAWVLHMLRTTLGDQAFWEGIRSYYATYRDGNATSEQFRDIMEAASSTDLDDFFQQWLYQPGHPELSFDFRYDASANKVLLELRQHQPQSFSFPLVIQIDDQKENVEVTQKYHQWTFDVTEQPDHVVLDPDVLLLWEDVNR